MIKTKPRICLKRHEASKQQVSLCALDACILSSRGFSPFVWGLKKLRIRQISRKPLKKTFRRILFDLIVDMSPSEPWPPTPPRCEQQSLLEGNEKRKTTQGMPPSSNTENRKQLTYKVQSEQLQISKDFKIKNAET